MQNMPCLMAQGTCGGKRSIFRLCEHVGRCAQFLGISLLRPLIPWETENTFVFKPA